MTLPAQIEAVLLDAGGVLLDLDYGYLRSLIKARCEPPEEDALSRAEAWARREMNRDSLADRSSNDAWRDYFRFLLAEVGLARDHHEAIIDSLWSAHRRVGLWTAPCACALDVVRVLKSRGLRLGVVSNAEGQVARDLDNAGYGGMFETVVDSALVEVWKPDPAIFAIALERMGLAVETTVYVGDLPAVDVTGARAAGLAPILVDRHDLYPESDVPRVRSIGELPDLLDDLAPAAPSRT